MTDTQLAGRDAVGPSACPPTAADPHTLHRFPKPRFPASVGAMPAVLLLVVLVAAGALASLRTPPVAEVSATTAAELSTAADGAAATVTAPAEAVVQSILREQFPLAADERGVLRRIAQTNPDVDGLAIVDPMTGAVVKDRGDAVPLPQPVPAAPQMTLVDDAMVVAVPVSPHRMVVASLPARAPEIPGAPPQRVILAHADGSIVAESTARPDVPAPLRHGVATGAARGEDAFAVDESKSVSRSATSAFAVPGATATPTDHVAAVGSASLPGIGAGTGLVAMVVREVAVTPGPSTSPGLTAAATVATGGILAFVLLHALLVRPVRRLHSDVDRLVSGVSGPKHSRRGPQSWIRRSRLDPADRIARIAPRLPLTTAGTRDMAPSPAPRLTVGGATLLVTVGILLVASLAGGFVAVGNHQAARADVLVENTRGTVGDTAEALEATLTEGLAALQSAASPTVGQTDSDWTAKLQALRAEQPAFRSVYVRDLNQTVVAAAGEAPRATTVPATPLAQLNQSGPEPIVTAAAPTHDGKFTLVAEFDPRTLNAALREAGVPTAVYDAGMRTVLGSEGYLSFSQLTDPVLHRAATASTVTPVAAVENLGDGEELIASQRIGQTAATAQLGWVLQQHRDVTAARYTVDPVGRAATVVVAAAALVTVGLLAWCYITAIQPLRGLNRWLEKTADAPPDRAVTPGPPPRYLDEVGGVMAGLNHCVKRR